MDRFIYTCISNIKSRALHPNANYRRPQTNPRWRHRYTVCHAPFSACFHLKDMFIGCSTFVMRKTKPRMLMRCKKQPFTYVMRIFKKLMLMR